MSRRKKLVRKHFRQTVFDRDGYKCVFCDETEDLDAHHITDRTLMPHGGYVLENGITLCSEHHQIAEVFHGSGHQSWEDGFHPEDLYRIIDSSFEKAHQASLNLVNI